MSKLLGVLALASVATLAACLWILKRKKEDDDKDDETKTIVFESTVKDESKNIQDNSKSRVEEVGHLSEQKLEMMKNDENLDSKKESLMEWIDRQLAEAEQRSRNNSPDGPDENQDLEIGINENREVNSNIKTNIVLPQSIGEEVVTTKVTTSSEGPPNVEDEKALKAEIILDEKKVKVSEDVDKYCSVSSLSKEINLDVLNDSESNPTNVPDPMVNKNEHDEVPEYINKEITCETSSTTVVQNEDEKQDVVEFIIEGNKEINPEQNSKIVQPQSIEEIVSVKDASNIDGSSVGDDSDVLDTDTRPNEEAMKNAENVNKPCSVSSNGIVVSSKDDSEIVEKGVGDLSVIKEDRKDDNDDIIQDKASENKNGSTEERSLIFDDKMLYEKKYLENVDTLSTQLGGEPNHKSFESEELSPLYQKLENVENDVVSSTQNNNEKNASVIFIDEKNEEVNAQVFDRPSPTELNVDVLLHNNVSITQDISLNIKENVEKPSPTKISNNIGKTSQEDDESEQEIQLLKGKSDNKNTLLEDSESSSSELDINDESVEKCSIDKSFQYSDSDSFSLEDNQILTSDVENEKAPVDVDEGIGDSGDLILRPSWQLKR